MDLLTLNHRDFVLSIECSKFDAIWNKAIRNVGEEHLTSTYSWSDGVVSANINDIAIENGKAAPAIFFDNTDYPIWIDFDKSVSHAWWGASHETDNERFNFRKGILAGFINYHNEIGRSEIRFKYRIGGEVRSFTFGFEVLSTKLNYHEHWRKIIEDIEQEYKMLSLDFMKRTFHGFSPDTDGETPELIWWSIFQNEQAKFVRACQNIIDRPKHRLHGREIYLRADKLKRIPTLMENELAEHRNEGNRLYRVEEQIQSHDTQENRFLKYALSHITKRYEGLKKQIESIKDCSREQKEQMNDMHKTLKGLAHHPFFRTVGKFKGLQQESLVLQKATGYSQVYRTWNILRRAYSLNDGIYRLQSKDIATLYEIWCFIEVSHIVRDQLGLKPEEIDHHNRTEMNGVFTWELGKGEHSKILFKRDEIELAQLIYNPKHTDRENDNISISNMVVPTVPQKPDIVLQLTKNDIEHGMKMTYLFDAKYRIDGKVGNVDVPPEETINQMHRYRDAIYYREYADAPLKKEVIGGYILFPGDGEPLEVQKSRFYKSISEVNIGAFPLRPKDEHNRELLENFIHELIERKSAETITSVIPQKGAIVKVPNRLLVGLVKESSRKGYKQSFIDGNATLYYTGSHFPTTISLNDLHFFMPYIKDTGVRDIYEIVNIRTIKASEAKQTDEEEDKNDIRLAFDLRFHRREFEDFRYINTHKLANYTFIDTTFDQMDEWILPKPSTL